jgi:hypothetical protein
MSGFFSSKQKPTGVQCIKLAVQLTEEEKQIIQDAGMAEEIFFIQHYVQSRREDPLSYQFRISWLFGGEEQQFLPKEQNTTALMELEQDLENSVRSLKARIDEVANRQTGKKTFEL